VTTELTITGMTCNGCVRHVDKALRAVPGVTAVEVVLVEHRARIVHDATAQPVALIAAIEEAGYQAAAT
jgi:copper chaperone CopZ